MAQHPFRRRRRDISPARWTRWKLDRIRRGRPWLTWAAIADGAGIRRQHLYDWLAGRRPFGPRLLRRLDRWARPLIAESCKL